LKGGIPMALAQGDIDRIKKMQQGVRNHLGASPTSATPKSGTGIGVGYNPKLNSTGVTQGSGGTKVQSSQPIVQNQPQIASNGGASTQGYIDQLMNARRAQQMAQLGKSRDKALSNLSQERAGIAPRYYDQRNVAAAGNQQAARNFADFMAARGSTNAGSNAQAQLMSNMSLQGNVGNLNRQEAQANDNIDRRTTDTRNAYQSDLVGLEQGLQSERLQALINQMNADRQFGLQEGSMMGRYNGQQTLAGLQNSQQFGLQQGSLTGNYLGTPTLANQQFQAGEQQRTLDNQFRNESFEYTKAMNELDNAFRDKQFNLAEADQLFRQNFQNRSLEQSAAQFAQQMGLNYSQLNQRDKEFLAEQTYRNEAMQLNKDQFKHTQMQDAVNTGLKRLDNEARSSAPQLSAGDFKTNPDFAQDYAFIINNPEEARQALEQNAQSFIEVYGLDGYKALYERAGGY
jgi:hypothetical protein